MCMPIHVWGLDCNGRPCVFQRAYTRLKRIHICDTHQHMLLQICLIVSHFPWAFGPYQRQMYMLARELSTRGHGLLWLSIAQQTVSAPDSFDHSFITFVDFNEPFVRTSKMNDIADKYHIDAYITLLDVERIIRDTDLKIPSIAWHPHHFNAWTPLDAYILRGFTTVASLDPAYDHFIPHIVEPIPPKAPWKRYTNNFMVLLQGGNYEQFDRKGWEISLQAFARFHKEVPDSHLYIHSVSKKTIMEFNNGEKAPWQVPDGGQPLRYLLHMLNITSYTLDEEIHPPEQISALKQAADVCLHPSRVEGFGMNILECQYFGTPVISTNFTAMAAFTRFGHAVPPLQLSYYLRGFVAVPNISGVVNALKDVYKGVYIGSATAAKKWIQNDFSTAAVVNAFEVLLQNKTLPRVDTDVRRVTGEYMDIMGVDENRLWTMFGHLSTVPSLPDNSDVVRILQRDTVVAVMVKNCLLLNIQIQTTWVPKVLTTIMAAPHVVTSNVFLTV